ncbi:DUF502 domain-containing protein [Lacimonas salitolerans]|uniref:DUF502 domain-containing protein n=1 Tax=Lacimonas salitolerans TaxID=1323750 RepID=A0ABW4EFH7_9RHOB
MTNPLDPKKPLEKPRKPGVFARMRSSFLTGIVVIAPVGLTVWLIWTLIGWVDGFVLPFVPQAYQPDELLRALIGAETYAAWLGEDAQINIRGVGVVFFLMFTIFVGWLAKGFIGRSLIRWGEHLVDRMPVVRSIYSGAKQIAETVFAQSESSFEKACMVEYPRKGIWAIGFISTEAKGEVAARIGTGQGLLSVFVPTTPNPTSGFLLYVPQEDVVELEMSVEDAAKLVISAGLVYPGPKDPAKIARDNAKALKQIEKAARAG